MTLLTLIQKSHNNNSSLYIKFIDFRKAFYTIPRSMLWSKLFALGIRGHVYSVLKALCTVTTACIRTAYGMTHQFNQDIGVRQGCVLAPLLFVLFILDLSFALDLYPKLGLGNTSFNHLLYADDLVCMQTVPNICKYYKTN